MKTAVLAALAAACLFASAPVKADEPPCQDLAASRVKAQEIADQAGAGLINLDGDKAKRFMDFLNDAEPKTDYKAEHISVLMIVRGGFALVVMDDSPCHGYQSGIKVPLDLALKAYRAAVGQGV